MSHIIGRGRYAKEAYPIRSNRIIAPPTMDLTLTWSFTTGAAQMGPFTALLEGQNQTSFTVPQAATLVFVQFLNRDPVPDGGPGPMQLQRNGAPIASQFPALPNTIYQLFPSVALNPGDLLTAPVGGGFNYNTHTFSVLAVLRFQ